MWDKQIHTHKKIPRGIIMNSYQLLPQAVELLPITKRNPITTSEKAIVGANAFIGAAGTTVGIIVEGIWFASTPVKAVGLGIGLSGGVAAATIAVAGVLSLAVAIPIAVYAYRELIGEAESINKSINELANQLEQNHKNIFFQLLRLRALKNCDADFIYEANAVIAPCAEIDKKDALLKLVSATYRSCEKNNYALKDEKATCADFLRDSNETSVKDNQKKLWQQLIQKDSNLASNLENCFASIPEPPVAHRGKAAFYGAVSALVVAGSALGISWAFSAMVVAAGLSALVPFAGWAVLGIAAITMGIMFGLGIGIFKQKNIQRDELRKSVELNNTAAKNSNDVIHKKVVELTPSNLNVVRKVAEIEATSTAKIKLITQQADARVQKAEAVAAEFKSEVDKQYCENQRLLQKIKQLEASLQGKQPSVPVTGDSTSSHIISSGMFKPLKSLPSLVTATPPLSVQAVM